MTQSKRAPKKRLSDLLKEESGHLELSPPESEPTREVEAAPMTNGTRTSKARTNGTRKRAGSSSSTKAKSTSTARRSTGPTKADLQDMVKDLKAALAESQTESENLQAQLHDKEGYVEELRGYLDKANELKAELDKSQKAIAQLEEENASLRKDLSTAQSAKKNGSKAITPRKTPGRPGLLAKAAPGGEGLAYGRRPVAPTTNPSQDGEDFSKQTWLL
ncbi:MAG: hypothetical protein AAF268_11285 [Cyanobacteria bacterium P01_A01_bin.3]